MRLVWKLLRENISKPQLIGFFFSNLIGLSIVLLALQFYFDVNPLFSGGEQDNLFKKDYLTITKKIGVLTNVSSKNSEFSEKEIEDLKGQTFIKDIGIYNPSQYTVFAGIKTPNSTTGFSTQMFFESIPDKFIDVKSDDWHFDPQSLKVPIILPKNYLDLYNFGFAEANSLPKIPEGMIGIISLDITIVGKNNQIKKVIGRIVGFSSRLNTILVPESFMFWANQSLGGNTVSRPSKLIVEIDNIANPNLTTYFQDKGYQISGDNAAASKMSFFLKIIVTIVITIGIVICGLSFFVLILSIYLILEKNMSKLRVIRLIGYSKSTVVRPYEYLVLVLNLTILIVSFIIVFIMRTVYLELINKVYISLDMSFSGYTIIFGFVIFILLSLFNIFIIRKKVE